MAQIFRFRLATLLQVRRLREEQARLQMARILQTLAESRQILVKTEQLQAHLFSRWHRARQKGWTAPDYQLFQNYLEYLAQTIAGLRAEIAQQETRVQAQREKLRQLSQERKLLEKLRKKQFIRFQQEQNARFQKEADDMALLTKPLRKPGDSDEFSSPK